LTRVECYELANMNIQVLSPGNNRALLYLYFEGALPRLSIIAGWQQAAEGLMNAGAKNK